MGRKFGDLDRYYDPSLTVTLLGKEYQLPLPSAQVGLWCRRAAETYGRVSAASSPEEMRDAIARAAALAAELPELPGDLTFEQHMLGSVYAQMVADGVPDPYIGFCAATAYVWITFGEDAAARYYTSGGRPEWLARGNRAQQKAATQAAGTATRTPSTGGESGTRSPASSSGTRSRRKSGSRGRGGRSAGRTS